MQVLNRMYGERSREVWYGLWSQSHRKQRVPDVYTGKPVFSPRIIARLEPIILNLSFLSVLVRAIGSCILDEPQFIWQLYYVSAWKAFERVVLCDSQLGYIYKDFDQLRSYLSYVLLPSAIATYVEHIGQYQLRSGQVVIPSFASFLPDDWLNGGIPQSRNPYILDSILYPPHFNESGCLDAFGARRHTGKSITPWKFLPGVFEQYRERTSALCLRAPTGFDLLTFVCPTECRSALLPTPVGTARTCASVVATGADSCDVFSCQRQPASYLEGASLVRFHLADQVDLWPVQNQRLLWPRFQYPRERFPLSGDLYRMA